MIAACADGASRATRGPALAAVVSSRDGTNTFVTTATKIQKMTIGIASTRSSLAIRGRLIGSAGGGGGGGGGGAAGGGGGGSATAWLMPRSPCRPQRRPH